MYEYAESFASLRDLGGSSHRAAVAAAALEEEDWEGEEEPWERDGRDSDECDNAGHIDEAATMGSRSHRPGSGSVGAHSDGGGHKGGGGSHSGSGSRSGGSHSGGGSDANAHVKLGWLGIECRQAGGETAAPPSVVHSVVQPPSLVNEDEIGPDDSISVAWFKQVGITDAGAHAHDNDTPGGGGSAVDRRDDYGQVTPVTIESADGAKSGLDVELKGLRSMGELRRGMLQMYRDQTGEQLLLHRLRVHARLANGTSVLLTDTTPLSGSVLGAVSFYVWSSTREEAATGSGAPHHASRPAPDPSVEIDQRARAHAAAATSRPLALAWSPPARQQVAPLAEPPTVTQLKQMLAASSGFPGPARSYAYGGAGRPGER